MDKYYTVEYSYNQDCFHVDRLDIILEKNKRTFINGESNDYQILAIVTNIDETLDLANKLRERIGYRDDK